jgi:hypothetical protein
LDENLFLFEQNNKVTRKSIKATTIGSARVMSYEDIIEAQKQQGSSGGSNPVSTTIKAWPINSSTREKGGD